MQIPNRLKVIGSFIHEGAYIADIGADHGLLELFIALNFKDYHILAVENKLGPLSALHETAGCLKNVSISHSDGLNQVTPEYDTVVLAGMGGETIIDILNRNVEKLENIKNIIVDAHSFIPKVRKYLIGKGYDIDREVLVFESEVYYNIISFKRNKKQKSYSEDQLQFGYNLYLDPLYEDYKKYVIQNYKNVLNKIENCNQSKKYNEIADELRRFEAYGQN